jgi:hypothetical protein
MKLASLLTLATTATVVNAAYPGDIVYYWYFLFEFCLFQLCCAC